MFGMLMNGVLRHETVGNCLVCLRARLHLPLGDRFANWLSCVNLCQIHCLVIASVTRIQQVYFVWSVSQRTRFVNALVIGLQTGSKYLVTDWPAVSMEWCHRSNVAVNEWTENNVANYSWKCQGRGASVENRPRRLRQVWSSIPCRLAVKATVVCTQLANTATALVSSCWWQYLLRQLTHKPAIRHRFFFFFSLQRLLQPSKHCVTNGVSGRGQIHRVFWWLGLWPVYHTDRSV